MAESLNTFLNEAFELNGEDIRTYSPLTLAYIGDSIFDVVVRSILVNRGNTSVNKLHQRASAIVNARSQADIINAIMDELTEDEKDIYRRGRNSKPHTKAKNASTQEYLEATGFEALIGYLYLQDKWDRIVELTKLGFEKTEVTE